MERSAGDPWVPSRFEGPEDAADGASDLASELGFTATLALAERMLRASWDQVRRGGGRIAGPLYFDSTTLCVSAYEEALDRVKGRFWATTFLSSGFWTGQPGPILQANRSMMQRLAASGGSVRRLFLLDEPPERVLQACREQRVLLDRLGKRDELRRLDAEFENLKANVDALAAEGCDLRVVHDQESHRAMLPPAMQWTPDDSELAIYDDFRVDIFTGGRTGRITSVACYSKLMQDFAARLAAAERFFDQLWSQADRVADFVERLGQVVAASGKRIHYRANWLARFEFALDADDAAVKSAEAEHAVALVRRADLWGRIGAYLDVGTCTGRYLLLFREALREGGLMVGLDDDAECLDFARGNIHQQFGEDPSFELVHADFGASEIEIPGAPFDLVTCMMSTLSHFGSERRPGHDLLRRVLDRMAGLLSPSGLLIFSTWSKQACRDGRFLSIYDDLDGRRLAEWTPGEDELRARLSEAGFKGVQVSRPHDRLLLWACCRSERIA